MSDLSVFVLLVLGVATVVYLKKIADSLIRIPGQDEFGTSVSLADIDKKTGEINEKLDQLTQLTDEVRKIKYRVASLAKDYDETNDRDNLKWDETSISCDVCGTRLPPELLFSGETCEECVAKSAIREVKDRDKGNA
jgi:hypothetical protein